MAQYKEDVEAFIKTLETEYLSWYERSERRNTISWYILQYLTIITGFLTSILIAIAKEDSGNGYNTVLVILPSIGSLAATLLMHFKVHEVWKMREDGRICFLKLIFEGKTRLLKCKSEPDYIDLLEYLHSNTVKIEKEQGANFFKTYLKAEDSK